MAESLGGGDTFLNRLEDKSRKPRSTKLVVVSHQKNRIKCRTLLSLLMTTRWHKQGFFFFSNTNRDEFFFFRFKYRPKKNLNYHYLYTENSRFVSIRLLLFFFFIFHLIAGETKRRAFFSLHSPFRWVVSPSRRLPIYFIIRLAGNKRDPICRRFPVAQQAAAAAFRDH